MPDFGILGIEQRPSAAPMKIHGYNLQGVVTEVTLTSNEYTWDPNPAEIITNNAPDFVLVRSKPKPKTKKPVSTGDLTITVSSGAESVEMSFSEIDYD
jgi:hypothetical protein